MRRYFAFGANLSPRALAQRLGSPPGPGPSLAAALQDWELRFDVQGYWPQVEGAFASAAPRKGERIYGVVHMLSEEQLHVLDGLEGVPEGQNLRVEGGRLRDLNGSELPGEGCTFYTCGPSMRLPEGVEARPSARYLEMLESAAVDAGLPPAWAESFAERRRQLPRCPSLPRQALVDELPGGAAAISFASPTLPDQALTSLCGLVFVCEQAREVALAVLRRGARPWRGEKLPEALTEARHLWGSDRVEEILSCWLAQFRALFGPPVGLLAEDWEVSATPHRLPL
ncbi:GGCT [Symbiodinium natans]|uniref:gamma-glutamylcyclotransferase n=1 Tax=Symbiodinium natans TaxID=878477 RepID=A0A812ICR9_9DINO|nr:GGCT [Symbiodinium natans]